MPSSLRMVVPLRELPVKLDLELSNAFVRAALDGMPMRAALDRPEDDPAAGAGRAGVELYMEEENVFVRGRVDGWLEVACSRCVGPARVMVNEDLQVTYLPKTRLPSDHEHDDSPNRTSETQRAGGHAAHLPPSEDDDWGVLLTDDDLDLYGYEGEEIDLAPMFCDQFVLAVPFAPLCKDDCQGLCPHCGVNRNHEACHCQPPGDPRFMALKDVKL